MAEAPAQLIEGGGALNIIEDGEGSTVITKEAQKAADQMRAQFSMNGGGGGGGGGGIIGRIIKLAIGTVLVGIILKFKGATEHWTRPARKIRAAAWQDQRWSFNDMSEGLQVLTEQSDAVFGKLQRIIPDLDTPHTLPALADAHADLRSQLYEARDGHPQGDIPKVKGDLGHHPDNWPDTVWQALVWARNHINSLASDVSALWGQIVRLDQAISDLWQWTSDQLIALEARVTNAIGIAIGHLVTGRIVPLEQAVQHEVTEETVDRPWVRGMAALLPLAAASTLVPTLMENEQKLRSQCQWSFDDWQQIMNALLLLLGIGAIVAVVEEAAGALDEIWGWVQDVLLGALPPPYTPPPGWQ